MEENVIEVCVGVGMDQFTPEYIKIVIPRDVVQNEEETKQELLPDFKITKNIFDFVSNLSDTKKEEPKDTLPK